MEHTHSPPSSRGAWLALVALMLGSVLLPPTEARGAGGDVASIGFAASSPATYDHRLGGGAWDDGTVGKTDDIVQSLQGGDYACGDIVTYLLRVEMSASPADANQTLRLRLRFLADTTGQTGAAHTAVLRALVNRGAVTAGDGPADADAGIVDDGGSSAKLVASTFLDDSSGAPVAGPFTSGASLVADIEIDDLEAAEVIVVRVDVRLGCKPGSSPTGNLQASLSDASIVAPVQDSVSAGGQTIPFKQIGGLAGIGDARPVVVSTVAAVGSACPGSKGVAAKAGGKARHCYALANHGTEALFDVAGTDDAASPGDPSDDVPLQLVGLVDVDGDGASDDLPAGKTADYATDLDVPAGLTGTRTHVTNVSGLGSKSPLTTADAATVEVVSSLLSLSTDHAPSVASAGDVIGYSLTITNNGTAEMGSPEVSLVLPGIGVGADPEARVTVEPGSNVVGLAPVEAELVSPATRGPRAGTNVEQITWRFAGQKLPPGAVARIDVQGRVGENMPAGSGPHTASVKLSWQGESGTVSTLATGLMPVSVTSGGAASSGNDGGLESSGRLAALLARRAIRRSQTRRPRLWVAPTCAMDSDLLSCLIPASGPGGSAPLDVTPSDLTGITNAIDVASADFVDDKGIRRGTAFLVLTEGAGYDHGKALCDRAAGAAVRSLQLGRFAGGAAVRAHFADARRGISESAVLLRAHLRPTGGGWAVTLHSAWLADDYPAVAPSDRVIGLQIWAARPGDDLWLASRIVGALAGVGPIQWGPEPKLPARYLRQGRTLGGRVALTLATRDQRALPMGWRLRAVRGTATGETGPEDLGGMPWSTDDQALNLLLPLFRDATFELLHGDRVVDRLWLSDGAWTAFDDGMWGGGSRVLEFDDRDCATRSAAARAARGDDTGDWLELSGCASVEAQVAEFAGVARHLGGGLAPVDLSNMRTAVVWLRSASSTELCFDLIGANGAVRPCARLPASPEGRLHAIDLRALQLHGAPFQAPLSGVRLVTVVSRTAGPARILAAGLAFGERPLPAPPGPSGPEAVQDQGCTAAPTSTGSRTGAPWVALLLIAMVLRRRWRQTPL